MLTGCLLPGSDPWFGVHLQTSTPVAMFLGASGEEASLRCELLCNSPDMIRLKSTAATNEADTGVIGLSGVLVHIPATQDSGLQT